MKRICVYCGAKGGNDPAYLEAAGLLGRTLAEQEVELVFGGGSVGMMGAVADGALAAGGKVIGVIPDFLATRELLHPGATEMHVVHSMHARKALMVELSDAFLALPGGYGTLEELFEPITWAQLGLPTKPVGLLNVAGYFTHLVQFLESSISRGFITSSERQHWIVSEKIPDLLHLLRHHTPPRVPRKLDDTET